MNYIRILPLLLILLSACKSIEKGHETYTAFVGARIVDGNGGAPVENGVLLVQNEKVVSIGSKDDVRLPEGTTILDVSGKTIIPGIINAHGHVGNMRGIEGGHYSRENVIANLSIYARYGITTVVSLGDDREEAVSLRAVNDAISPQRARLFIAGEVITGKSSREAISALERNYRMGVDFMKIRVDDNLGTGEKMPEEIYRAVINRSHELGYKISTHMYYLEDARKLLEAGSDMLAHSVRDAPVDASFIELIKKSNASYCPTLTRELSTFVYGDTADFFTDPFFTREYDIATVRPLMDPARQLQVRSNPGARAYQQQLPTAMANLKTLSDEGVPVVFGTDSGMPTRFMGYFEHLEMEMMAEAGLTPMQIIVSATKNPAAYLDLKGLGTLVAGHWADFVILDDNPLADIRNVRKISAVFIGGNEIKR